jgi:sugar lactone lactonase YvrE
MRQRLAAVFRIRNGVRQAVHLAPGNQLAQARNLLSKNQRHHGITMRFARRVRSCRFFQVPIIAVLIGLASPAPARAHVGYGIVIDSHGVVYFADIPRATVWRLGRDGRVTAFVRGRHTHGLALDAADNLYGEDARSIGGRFRITLWRARPDGSVENLLSVYTDPPAENVIARDTAGDRYYWDGNLNSRAHSRIVRLNERGERVVVAGTEWGHVDGDAATARIGVIGALALGPAASIYATEGGRGAVRRITYGGAVTTIGGYPFAGVEHGNNRDEGPSPLMGLAVDDHGAVYVADHDHRCVRRIAPNGAVTTVFASDFVWTPSGVAVGGDGLYVLEHKRDVLDVLTFLHAGVHVRVRRLAPNGVITTLAAVR